MQTRVDYLQFALIELYMDVKHRIRWQQDFGYCGYIEHLRNQDDMEQLEREVRPSEEEIEEERMKLSSMNPMTIAEYVKSSIEILVNMKVRDGVEEEKMDQKEKKK